MRTYSWGLRTNRNLEGKRTDKGPDVSSLGVQGNTKRKTSGRLSHFLQPQDWNILEAGLSSMLLSDFMLLIFPSLDPFFPSPD